MELNNLQNQNKFSSDILKQKQYFMIKTYQHKKI